MAKHFQFCATLLLSVLVFVAGCSVDVQDPGEPNNVSDPADSGNTPPVIELQGESVIRIPLNSSFIDPGVVATDAEDGDITSSVYSNNVQVNSGRPGRYEITYRVMDSGNAQATPVKRVVIVGEPASDSAGPHVSYVEWIMVGETGAYLPLRQIEEGDILELSLVAGKSVNIIAQSESEAVKPGSVHFLLTGPLEIDRVENTPAYAMANEKSHLNVDAGEFPAGDYTLVVTPYSGPNASGDPGVPHLINFTVKGAPSPVPGVAVVANNDFYTYELGSDMQPGQVRAVSENDEYDAGAVFTITRTPRNGSARMFDLGFFTYTPKPGFVGTDSFTYQIAQGEQVAAATVSLKIEGAAETVSGFTVIKPSADSKLIYVSSSVGNDSNTCLSEASPCKTIKAGLAKMRNGYPDHLYLKRGDVWRGERLFNLHSGRSASEPAVMTYYGSTGARPKIENENSTLHIMKGKMMNFSFVGLEFSAYKMDPKNPEFTGDAHANIVLLGGNENILFEDNIFNYTEIIIQEYDSGDPANISLRRNIWTGAYANTSSISRDKRPSNLYTSGVTGLLIEENVFDSGGWNSKVKGAGANMFNHNIYIQASTDGASLRLRNNIITRGSSHGAQLRSGGIAENNFFGRNALGLLIGYDKEPLKTGVVAHALNNVISEGHSMVKGVDPCTGVNLCTSALVGLDFGIYGDADWQAHGNIASLVNPDDAWRTLYKSLTRRGLSKVDHEAVKSSNNISYGWTSETEGKDKGYPDPARTLASYNQTLGGEKSFDAFMDVVLNRPLGAWDEKYTAASINKYIRAGFGL